MKKRQQNIEKLINQLETCDPKEMNNEEWNSYGRLIRETNEVFIRESLPAPDAQAAWKQFRQKKRKQPKHNGKQITIWSSIVSVAAGVALFFLFKDTIHVIPTDNAKPIMAEIQSSGITLTTENSDRPVVELDQANSLLTSQGIEVSEKEINYLHTENTEKQTLTVPRGHEFKITLSDGTEVWLNAESSLTYPSKFEGLERVVELTGEGYFKVAPDKEHPFRVHTNTLNTRVTGTEFNVRSYRNEDTHITLIKGKIYVKSHTQQQETELSPGEDVSLDSHGRIIIENVDTYAYIQWKNGYFYFDDTPLGDVIRELERWYNIPFEIKDPSILTRRVHYVANRREAIGQAIENLNALGKEIASIQNDKIIIGNN